MASAVADVTSLPGAVPEGDARHDGTVILAAAAAQVDQLVEHLGDAQLAHAWRCLSLVLRHLAKQSINGLVHLQTARLS